jgi:hypothetical protein
MCSKSRARPSIGRLIHWIWRQSGSLTLQNIGIMWSITLLCLWKNTRTWKQNMTYSAIVQYAKVLLPITHVVIWPMVRQNAMIVPKGPSFLMGRGCIFPGELCLSNCVMMVLAEEQRWRRWLSPKRLLFLYLWYLLCLRLRRLHPVAAKSGHTTRLDVWIIVHSHLSLEQSTRHFWLWRRFGGGVGALTLWRGKRNLPFLF